MTAQKGRNQSFYIHFIIDFTLDYKFNINLTFQQFVIDMIYSI